jgi:4-oxalocrotonate tautomerase
MRKKYLTRRQKLVLNTMSKIGVDRSFRQWAATRGEADFRFGSNAKGDAMQLIHISLRAGKPEAYRQAIFDALYRAMRETLNVPEDDQFMTITEHADANFRTGHGYGIARSADVVYIQITVFNSRTAEQKQALFRRTAELLGERPGIRPEDVFVNVLDAPKENWSVATASRNSPEAALFFK